MMEDYISSFKSDIHDNVAIIAWQVLGKSDSKSKYSDSPHYEGTSKKAPKHSSD